MIPPLDLNAPGPMDAPEYGRLRCRQRAAVGGGGAGAPPPPPPTGPAAAEPSARRRAAGPVSPARRAPAGERTARVLAGYRRTAADRGWGQARPFGAADLVAVLGHLPRAAPSWSRESEEVSIECHLDAVIDSAYLSTVPTQGARPAASTAGRRRAHCWEATTRTFLERQRLPNVLPVDPGRVGVEQLADQAPRRGRPPRPRRSCCRHARRE